MRGVVVGVLPAGRKIYQGRVQGFIISPGRVGRFVAVDTGVVVAPFLLPVMPLATLRFFIQNVERIYNILFTKF